MENNYYCLPKNKMFQRNGDLFFSAAACALASSSAQKALQCKNTYKQASNKYVNRNSATNINRLKKQ